MELPERVTVWCCASCGKWSHAQRRPTWHKRLIRGIDPGEGAEPTPLPEGRTYYGARPEAAHLELPVIEVHPEQSGTTYDYGDPINGVPGGPVDDWYEPEGVTVKCGPFVAYEARLEAPLRMDPVAKAHARRLAALAADDGDLATAGTGGPAPMAADDLAF